MWALISPFLPLLGRSGEHMASGHRMFGIVVEYVYNIEFEIKRVVR